MNLLKYIAIFASLAVMSCHSNEGLRHDHDHDHDHDHETEGVHDHDEGHEHGEHEHGHEEGAHEPHDGLIEFSEAEAHRFGVVLTVPVQGEVLETVTLPGVLTGNSGSEIILTAAKTGKLRMNSNLREGASLRAGQSVATVAATAVSGGDADAATKARLKAVEAEIKRVKPLVDDGIVSRKDYNALMAEAEELRELSATAGGSGAVIVPAAGVVTRLLKSNGEFVSAGEPIALLRPSGNGSLMLRVDFPQRLAAKLATIKSATIVTPDGQRLTLPRAAASTTTDNGGYLAAYFGPLSHSGMFAGSAVEAVIATGSTNAALTVPAESLNEQEGTYSVFVKTSPGHYRRTIVKAGRTDGNRVEITSGLDTRDSVVSTGTVFIRLAETRANAPMGHSHNH